METAISMLAANTVALEDRSASPGRYTVAWKSLGKDQSGSMPLGHGIMGPIVLESLMRWLTIIAFVLVSTTVFSGCGRSNVILQPQQSCPFMGTAIRSDLFFDAPQGRIYTCCRPCVDGVARDPDGAESLLRARGERLLTGAEQKAFEAEPVYQGALVVLHDVNGKQCYRIDDFDWSVFVAQLEVEERVDAYSCLCVADYFIYVYENGTFARAVVIFAHGDSREIQLIEEERSGDMVLTKSGSSFVKRSVNRWLRRATKMPAFAVPGAAELER